MGFESPDHERARQDLKRQLQDQFSMMEPVYQVAESMYRAGGVTITKTRGLNDGTVTTIFLLLTKACKTSRAIRVVGFEGCGQDGAILLRALFETTTAVLWILQDNTLHRARLYAAHGDQRLLVLAEEQTKTPGLRRIGKSKLKAARARVQAWEPILGMVALKSARRHWSGQTSLEAAVKKLKRWHVAYNTVYRTTSSFAHGSDPLHHASFSRDSGSPVFKLLPGDAEVERVIRVARVLLYAILKRMNDRMGLGLDADLGPIRDGLANPARSNGSRKADDR